MFFRVLKASEVKAAHALLEEVLKAKGKAVTAAAAEAMSVYETTSLPDEPVSTLDEIGDDGEAVQPGPSPKSLIENVLIDFIGL